jgi:hypothetical protein
MRLRFLLVLVPIAIVAALVVAVSALAQGAPPLAAEPPPAAPAAGGYAEKREPAPIESVDIRPDPAGPGRYLAHVVFGLPGGCARPGGYEVHRDGDRLEVAVSIRLPAEARPCTMIYGTSRYDVPLGQLDAGRSYTVRVNDHEVTFGKTPPAATSTPAPALTPMPLPTAPGAANEAAVADAPYLDDRSAPERLLASYANALNRREYARAYSYWRPSAAASELPSFDRFAAGFAETEGVRLTLGEIGGDAGAGQLHYAVPTRLDARLRDGRTESFVGCYRLHIGRPQIQAAPPFQPLAIEGAIVKQVGPDEDADALLARACAGTGVHRPPPSI